MDEYIERESAIEAIMSEPPDAHYPQWYAEKIKSIPAADVAPVRHGWWVHETIEDDDWGGTYHSWSCSECKFSVGRNPTGENFCHKCGAKMDLEERDGK